jgi:alkanesulfonate monooxygenase SsuD/methylene tetrahydromethanopterin reductase-like flavin-dependent oxidoreductase (luciferase family)
LTGKKEDGALKISLAIEGMLGLTWPLWKRWVDMAEANGFHGLYRSDHFTVGAPDMDSLDCWTSMTYQADHSQRVLFGPLVSPFSFRDPVLLARQGGDLDDLSSGRFVLGVGAGWNEYEHTKFGYPLGDMDERFGRFEEGLQVITLLLRSEEPVSFDGQFYKLRDAVLLPRPQRPNGPPIMVGGSGPDRTARLVARYADIWNAHGLSPETLRERNEALDELLIAEGRRPQDVRRTMAGFCYFGHDDAALERRLQWPRSWDAELAEKSTAQQVRILNAEGNAFAGNADDVLERLHLYDEAGIDEVMLQWFDMDDIAGAEALADQVLANF